jgi:adenine-specific DNA-methyltransferase
MKLFYPIFVDVASRRVVGTGDWLPEGEDLLDVVCPKGQAVVWPIRKDGSHGNWQLGPAALMKHVDEGRVRLGGSLEKGYVVYYIKSGEYKKVLQLGP